MIGLFEVGFNYFLEIKWIDDTIKGCVCGRIGIWIFLEINDQIRYWSFLWNDVSSHE